MKLRVCICVTLKLARRLSVASVRFLFPFLRQLLWLFLKNVNFVDLLIYLLV